MSSKPKNKKKEKTPKFDIQLVHDVSNYETSNMIFAPQDKASIPGSNEKNPLCYRYVRISTKNPDGTVGPLILSLKNVFTPGVFEQHSFTISELTGYVILVFPWSLEGPSNNERAWTDKFSEITEVCKDYVLENIENLEERGIDLSKVIHRSNLTDMIKLKWLKDKKKYLNYVEGSSPQLTAKLFYFNNEIRTPFYDGTTGEPVNPLDFIKKKCMSDLAIKVESLYISSERQCLIIKLYEAEVRPLANSLYKRLLRDDAPNTNTTSPPELDNINEDENGSIVDGEEYEKKFEDDSEDEEQEQVKKRSKKKKKKTKTVKPKK